MILEVQKTEKGKKALIIAKLKTIWLTALSLSIAIALILNPKEALTASLRGLDLWWEIVFPSLLPFFITAELLIGFGVVHGLGVLCEKFMRPLFNVPGAGGFVWIMGMASGYPAGAKWTVDLRKKGQVSRIEAERLVAFTNSSSPLFLFGAVAVGFFHNPSLGILLALSHYGGNFIIGLLMRFYKSKESPLTTEKRGNASIIEAFRVLHQSRIKDGRPIGKLMGDAVVKSVDTLLMVGGFIMLFSVINELMKVTQAIDLFSYFLSWTSLPQVFHAPFIAGLLEMTTGIGKVTETHTSLIAQLIIASFILGFHGLSIQAQIASILAETDIRFKPYAIARIGHGCIAAILMVVLYHATSSFNSFQMETLPIWSPNESFTYPLLYWFHEYGPPITIMMIILMTAIKWRSEKN
ncbi:sporulation integral membrane protein YlbJ [Halobacillus salinarum]|uniref:Sporulation integral membrane protein YlbJ n=1 Tax=Halobacillus salinarum TaxID=2932257 RepID=A0ABY4EM17_9BACI|nr:sporulation integral membrane protein YlbJ [Halobacillus salinarum]UOQ43151.1 sporulation integral membrane protein YlbJ [Halobacillus salinarum]